MRPLAEAAQPPESSWDGVERICSARASMPLADAKNAIEEIADPEDLYDVEPDSVPLIDLSGLSPAEARSVCEAAQMMTKTPLAFRADGAQALDAALAVYTGVALADDLGNGRDPWPAGAPSDCNRRNQNARFHKNASSVCGAAQLFSRLLEKLVGADEGQRAKVAFVTARKV